MYSRIQYSQSKIFLPVSPKIIFFLKISVNLMSKETQEWHRANTNHRERRIEGSRVASEARSALHSTSVRTNQGELPALLSWKVAPCLVEPPFTGGTEALSTSGSSSFAWEGRTYAGDDKDRKQQHANVSYVGECTRFKNSESCTPSLWFPVKVTNQ